MSVSLEGLTPEAIADLAVALKSLTDNPKTRKQTLALMKPSDPTLNIPEIDIPMQLNQLLQQNEARMAKMEAARNEDRVRADILDRRNEIVKKGLVSEDEVKEVEKLMLEKGISSHETAAEFYASQKKSATPTPGTFGQPLFAKPDLKAMNGDINQWARSEAGKAMADIIKMRRA